MKHQEIMSLLAEMKLPYAYNHFIEGESPGPPFLVFSYPKAIHFAADGKAYFKTNRLNIELYTDLKNIELEEQVEGVLDDYGIFYVKSEVWIASEHLYEVIYEMEV